MNPSSMATPEGLWGLVLTSTVLIAIPGPTIMFLIGQTLSAGRKKALYGVLGNAIGMYGIAVLLSLGLGALMLRSPNVLTLVRLAGAAVLLFIGLQYIVSRPPGAGPDRARLDQGRGAQSITAGMIVGLTNPKAFIMFGTIVPSYLGKGAAPSTATLLACSLIPILLGIAIDAIWVMAAHSIGTRAVFDAGRMRRIHVFGGVLIVVMALLLGASAMTG